MTVALITVGLVLVAASLIDLIWTAVAAGSGAGPITSRLAGAMWRGALALHRRRPSHALLSFSGVVTVLVVMASWIAVVLGGWILVFTASSGAVRVADSQMPADLIGRIYFTGYTVFTLGNGDYVPGEGFWQLATVVAIGTGLILVTLSITYLVPVASAVSQRRQLASYISSLGTDPHEIIVGGWNGSNFGGITQHLVSLTSLLHTSGQHHLTYPVLHYFHSQSRHSAAPPNIANLSQALLLLRKGVVADARPDAALLEPLDRAIAVFLNTLHGARLAPGIPLPPPTLDPLRRVGIPVVADDDYVASAAGSESRRGLLGALLADDGWEWNADAEEHDVEANP